MTIKSLASLELSTSLMWSQTKVWTDPAVVFTLRRYLVFQNCIKRETSIYPCRLGIYLVRYHRSGFAFVSRSTRPFASKSSCTVFEPSSLQPHLVEGG